jgi:DNA polymerase-1
MNNKTLLIDGDVLAFEGSVVAEESIEWKDEMWTVHADMTIAKNRILNRIVEFKDLIGADEVVVALTDRANFRRKLYPSYKSNRSKSRLPIILKEVKKWMLTDLDAQLWPNLEADDVLSILATDRCMDEETVIVSIDKDFKSVPGIFYDYNKKEYHHPSEEEADNFHLIQSITGDSTDGFGGVPKVGPVGAKKALDANGYTWETVVAMYKKAGLTEEDALTNAWMARLLRTENYNQRKKVIKNLWTPRNYQTKDILKISPQAASVTGTLDVDDPTLYLQSPYALLPDDLKKEERCTETIIGRKDSRFPDSTTPCSATF